MPQIANQKNAFNPGQEIFSWTAHDYHPHERGKIWFGVFGTIFLGGALWSWIADPKWGWITSISLLIVAGFYFWVHRFGDDFLKIILTNKGILINNRFFHSWEKFEGFWFVYDETVAMINFQFMNSPQKISLQMGEIGPEQFRELFEKTEFPELTDKKESLSELWIRALKL